MANRENFRFPVGYEACGNGVAGLEKSRNSNVKHQMTKIETLQIKIATDAAEQMEENSIIIWPRLCYSNTILNGMPLLPFEFLFLLSYCWCFFRYIFVKVFHYISLLFDSVYHLFIKIFHLMCTYTMVTLWYGS